MLTLEVQPLFQVKQGVDAGCSQTAECEEFRSDYAFWNGSKALGLAEAGCRR